MGCEIRSAHDMVENAARATVEYAIRAGELLIEAKAQVRHGEWLPWLEANSPGHVNTAGGYMRLARNSQRVVNMGATSVREALAELAEPRTVEFEPVPAPAEIVDAVVVPAEPDPVQRAIIEQTRGKRATGVMPLRSS